MTRTGMLTAARAEALFSSDVPVGEPLNARYLTAVIKDAVHRLGGVRGCAAAVAAVYGDYPEIAVPRMRWALGVVTAAYGTGVPPSRPRLRRVIATAGVLTGTGQRG